jgi:hypothetical protein|tara:strand:+ start:585 stop:977 length:393 start_codon:yes stop_codon:yes gene_type:complete
MTEDVLDIKRKPWTDPRGFQSRRREAMKTDVNSGEQNFKRSALTILDDSMFDEVETTFNVVTVYEVYEVLTDEQLIKPRTKGRIVAFVEFVDPYGTAHQIELPGELIQRIEAQRKRLISENRSRRGKERS